MVQPPPTVIRYLILIAAISLLGLAVCAKTEKAQSPQRQRVPQAEARAVGEEPEETSIDAGLQPGANQAEQQAPNPPASTAEEKKKVLDDIAEELFFPATKSGGML